TKAHSIRLNPTPEQEQYFLRAAGVARFAWNWSLNEYKRLKSAGQKVDWNQLKKDFRSRREAEFPFVREVTKCAAEEALSDLRRSISTYYKTKAQSPQCHFPGFRKRSKRIGGFGLTNDKFSCLGNAVRIPKLGIVNMAEPVRFAGRVLSGRVTERAGHWYLTVTVEEEKQPTAAGKETVLIDFGLKSFATLSTGEVVETQGYFRQAEQRLRGLQRGLARKRKGSHNRSKWKQKIARAHERVRCQRQDFLHKFTTQMVTTFDTICIEDLNLTGLCRTRLAKSFYDAGVGEAVRQLIYKTDWAGSVLQQLDRFFPSSKLCHWCGFKNETLTLSDRGWTCVQCGAVHDRDENAAINLELEGLRLLAGNG
ncbi:MAG: RNA-guided endonuclease InsQ/TnpB family protein, partial [Terriglobia bacterium]